MPPASPRALEQTIDLGNYQLNIIPAPGHTDDSIFIHEPEQGWLFTGDTLYDGELYTNFPNTHLTHWNKSLEQIKTLDPKITFPGHNGTIHRKKLRKILDHAILSIDRSAKK